MGLPGTGLGLPPEKASPLAQRVKRLPAMPETWVQFMGREDPLEKEMAKWEPTPVLLPGKSYEQTSLVGYSPWGRRVGHD